jgi:hypothetical protein
MYVGWVGGKENESDDCAISNAVVKRKKIVSRDRRETSERVLIG